MKLSAKRIISLLLAVMLVCGLFVLSASAADAEPAAEAAAAESSTGSKAIAAAVVVGIVATAAALGMAIAIGKGMSRQPEASGSIRSSMMLGLVFIETVVIYALIVAILIIFVL